MLFVLQLIKREQFYVCNILELHYLCLLLKLGINAQNIINNETQSPELLHVLAKAAA